MRTDINPYIMPGLKDSNFETVATSYKRQRSPNLVLIRETVCNHFDIPHTNLAEKKRTRFTHVWPRQIYCWLAKKYSVVSLNEIGATIGGRDHSTVLHAISKIVEAQACSIHFPDPLWEMAQDVENEFLFKAKIPKQSHVLTKKYISSYHPAK